MLKKLNYIYFSVSIFSTNLHSIFIIMQTYTFFSQQLTIISFFLLFLNFIYKNVRHNEN